VIGIVCSRRARLTSQQQPMMMLASAQTTMDDDGGDVVRSATRRQRPNRVAASCIHISPWTRSAADAS
jgi:hypothetical protein